MRCVYGVFVPWIWLSKVIGWNGGDPGFAGPFSLLRLIHFMLTHFPLRVSCSYFLLFLSFSGWITRSDLRGYIKPGEGFYIYFQPFPPYVSVDRNFECNVWITYFLTDGLPKYSLVEGGRVENSLKYLKFL